MSEEFLKQLKELCLKFDEKYAEWPEHYYEGQAVYGFALEQFGLEDTTTSKTWGDEIANSI